MSKTATIVIDPGHDGRREVGGSSVNNAAINQSMRNHIARISISIIAITALLLNWKLRDGKEFTTTDLIFVGIALLPWIGEFIESITWGKDREINFRERLEQVEEKAIVAEEKANVAEEMANVALDAGLRGIGKGSLLTASKPASGGSTKTIASKDSKDPQKGKWGGKASVDDRTLIARVEQIAGEDYFRRVIMEVRSNDPDRPLAGTVRFHLHPTFSEPVTEVKVRDGVARLSLVSYGAFTVGAEVLEPIGTTELELDITTLSDGNDKFFER